MLTLFFAPEIALSSIQRIEGSEADHGIKSLRLGIGEKVKVTDGKGNWISGPVCEIGKKYFDISIIERASEKVWSPRLIVIQALTKSDRMKETIELLTEAGANLIIPWESERSIAKWQNDSASKWRELALTASKQSRRVNFPLIGDLIATDEIGEKFSEVLVLNESASTPISSISLNSTEIVLVVGPEGGISDAELVAIGGTPVRLGNEVLRSAHAGLAALAAIQTLLKRW